MDSLLADYGSDSDDETSSKGGADASPAAALLLPPPQWQGPAGWVHGNANHFHSTQSMTTTTTTTTPSSVATTNNNDACDAQRKHLLISAAKSYNANTPTLAHQLRAQHDFTNPLQMEKSVTDLRIDNPWQTVIDTNTATDDETWEDWEYTDQLLVLEEKARANHAADENPPTAASSFVQDQISRAMGRK